MKNLEIKTTEEIYENLQGIGDRLLKKEEKWVAVDDLEKYLLKNVTLQESSHNNLIEKILKELEK